MGLGLGTRCLQVGFDALVDTCPEAQYYVDRLNEGEAISPPAPLAPPHRNCQTRGDANHESPVVKRGEHGATAGP